MNDWMTVSMKNLSLFFGFGFFSIMGLLCLMLLYKMWTNQIDLSSLLKEANGDASMSRFQLLVFSLVVAVGLYLYMLNHLGLPDVPQSILTLLGISASTYAAGKGISFSRPEGVTKPTAVSSPAPTPPPDSIPVTQRQPAD
jgi:hypothetical protein